MANLLDWKDILRPIRDGYRHLFPSPDMGPTPEERHKRREEDRLKGFSYFDTFEQLEAWTEGATDALQRANTPLLPRFKSDSSEHESKSAGVLLCHDYGGNYHDYEDARDFGLDVEMYACEYLQYIETFVYFSHKLVCVPPPSWTNTLHRSGVRSLGVILVEPQTTATEQLLRKTEDGEVGSFTYATKLASIAKHHGFDGYLVNIEKPFPKEHWSVDVFRDFLKQLRSALGEDKQLIWYDALTISNKISYQNSLNTSNLPFAQACGRILTNYCWTESQAKDSQNIATHSGLLAENIYFGIDVWAQNSTKLTQPRTTYPLRGGGGTKTGVAVAKLSDIGLSAGVFAPAWSFEHFPGHGRDVERVIWEGDPLPDDLSCSCGDAALRHQSNPDPAIVEAARVFPAGSDTFFYTDFQRAFGRHSDTDRERLHNGHLSHAQLGAQSPLPLPASPQNRANNFCLSHRLRDGVGSTTLIIEAHDEPSADEPTDQDADRWLSLYKLNMPANGSLRLRVLCQNHLSKVSSRPSIYLRYSREQRPQLLPIETGRGTVDSVIDNSSDLAEDSRLVDIGVHLRGSTGPGTQSILEISSISITPQDAHTSLETHKMTSMKIQHRGDGDNAHIRLCWTVEGNTSGATAIIDGMPYSNITGLISYFHIDMDGVVLGRAYALEHILSQRFYENLVGKTIECTITGIGFDGRRLATRMDALHMEPLVEEET